MFAASGLQNANLEILDLIAKGMSNREIADQLFVSENTIKTHSSRLFDKLSAKRRTQAVQIGKEMGLIPEALTERPEEFSRKAANRCRISAGLSFPPLRS